MPLVQVHRLRRLFEQGRIAEIAHHPRDHHTEDTAGRDALVHRHADGHNTGTNGLAVLVDIDLLARRAHAPEHGRRAKIVNVVEDRRQPHGRVVGQEQAGMEGTRVDHETRHDPVPVGSGFPYVANAPGLC